MKPETDLTSSKLIDPQSRLESPFEGLATAYPRRRNHHRKCIYMHFLTSSSGDILTLKHQTTADASQYPDGCSRVFNGPCFDQAEGLCLPPSDFHPRNCTYATRAIGAKGHGPSISARESQFSLLRRREGGVGGGAGIT